MLRYVFLVYIISTVCQSQNKTPETPSSYVKKVKNFGALSNSNKNQLNEPQNINWCSVQKKYCGEKLHIGCKPNHIPQGNCSNSNIIEITEKLKELIVNRHNEYRSFLASGFLNGLPPAKQMQEMKWDSTLAYLARLHVRNCNFKHDQCRATPDNHFAGQNLGAYSSTILDSNLESGIRDMIKHWFEEFKDTPVSLIERFSSPVNKTVGHFTAIVRDHNNKIGCALIRFQEIKDERLWYSTMFTCNYAESNIIEKAVYAEGKPCSGCESDGTMVCSRKYTNLCSKIDPKELGTDDEEKVYIKSSQ